MGEFAASQAVRWERRNFRLIYIKYSYGLFIERSWGETMLGQSHPAPTLPAPHDATSPWQNDEARSRGIPFPSVGSRTVESARSRHNDLGWRRFHAEDLDGCDCDRARRGHGRVQQVRCSRPAAEVLQARRSVSRARRAHERSVIRRSPGAGRRPADGRRTPGVGSVPPEPVAYASLRPTGSRR